MMFRRRFTLVFIPQSAKARTFGGFFALGCSMQLAFIIVLVIWSLGTTYVFSLFDGGKLASMERENDRLRERLDTLKQRTEAYQIQMDAFIQQERDARVIVGLPDIHPAIRRLGVGGPEKVPNEGMNSPASIKLADEIRDTLDGLLRETHLEQASLNDIKKRAEQNKNYWRHIPTVKPANGHITSRFGLRTDPFNGFRRMHEGIDIAARHSDKVQATAAGEVIQAGMDTDYGYFVDIDHHNGFVTRYGHLSKIITQKHAHVNRRDIIGLVGNTGRASGYHLHYEIYYHNRVVDPSLYLFSEKYVMD